MDDTVWSDHHTVRRTFADPARRVKKLRERSRRSAGEPRGYLGAGMDPEGGEDVLNVGLDGTPADDEGLGDLLVAHPPCDEFGDLLLPLGQPTGLDGFLPACGRRGFLPQRVLDHLVESGSGSLGEGGVV